MSLLLILLFLLLLVGVLYQIVKIGEYANVLRKEDAKDHLTLENESKTQAAMFVGFMVALACFMYYIHISYQSFLLPISGSEHGATIDALMKFTMILIWLMFVSTHIVLTFFVWKYRYSKNRRATFYAHNNKLEMAWTIVPAVILTALVIYGLTVWNTVMFPKTENAFVLEIYAQQFKWTARYSGKDAKLGDHNYRLTDDATNPLAIDLSKNKNGEDDIMASDTIYLPKNRNVLFYFRSRDVIHSAYMPHFRAQMNCVPGHITQFGFKPIFTTEEMRLKTNNPNFNYMMLCNKICGSSHWSMPMVIKVTDEKTALDWWYAKKDYKTSLIPAEEPVAKSETADSTNTKL